MSVEGNISGPQPVQGPSRIETGPVIGAPDVQGGTPVGNPPETLVTLPGVQAIDQAPRTRGVTGFTAGTEIIPTVQTATGGAEPVRFGFQAASASAEGPGENAEASVEGEPTLVTLPTQDSVTGSLDIRALPPGRYTVIVEEGGDVTVGREATMARVEGGEEPIHVINPKDGIFGVADSDGYTQIFQPGKPGNQLLPFLMEHPGEHVELDDMAPLAGNYSLIHAVVALAKGVNKITSVDTIGVDRSEGKISGLTYDPTKKPALQEGKETVPVPASPSRPMEAQPVERPAVEEQPVMAEPGTPEEVAPGSNIKERIALAAARAATIRAREVIEGHDHQGWLSDDSKVAAGVQEVFALIEEGKIKHGAVLSANELPTVLGYHIAPPTATAVISRLHALGFLGASKVGKAGSVDASVIRGRDENR